jgi:methionine-rich copper-binding protein CopC
MRRTSHITRLAGVAASLVLVTGLAAPAALAHVDVVATSPKAGAALRRPPAAVTVTFSAQILRGSIVVKNGRGSKVSLGKGGVDPRDVRRLRVRLRNGLNSGAYVVRWHVEAPDGHEQDGLFRFRVR